MAKTAHVLKLLVVLNDSNDISQVKDAVENAAFDTGACSLADIVGSDELGLVGEDSEAYDILDEDNDM